MKKILTVFSLLFIVTLANAAYGYYGDCSTFVELNYGSTTTTYKAGACSSNSNTLDGTNLGTIAALQLRTIQAFTWQNGGDNVMNGKFYYRIYTGAASGSYTEINLTTIDVLGGGNARRYTNPDVNLMLSLSPSTIYTFECYFMADVDWNVTNGTADAQIYMSNSNNNYNNISAKISN